MGIKTKVCVVVVNSLEISMFCCTVLCKKTTFGHFA